MSLFERFGLGKCSNNQDDDDWRKKDDMGRPEHYIERRRGGSYPDDEEECKRMNEQIRVTESMDEKRPEVRDDEDIYQYLAFDDPESQLLLFQYNDLKRIKKEKEKKLESYEITLDRYNEHMLRVINGYEMKMERYQELEMKIQNCETKKHQISQELIEIEQNIVTCKKELDIKLDLVETPVDAFRTWTNSPNSPSKHMDRNSMPLMELNNDPKFIDEMRLDIGMVTSLFQTEGARNGVKLDPGLTGLLNNGNVCFMNACLQPLSNIPVLRDYFRKYKFITYLNMNNRMGTKGAIACAFSALQLILWSGYYLHVNPVPILYRVSRFVNGMFNDGRQHDAQEFLGTLLDALHEDVNQVTNRQITEQNNDDKSLVVAGREAWRNAQKFGWSEIYRLLQGQTVSILECDSCGKQSTTFDTFTQISLELPKQKECTLKECLSMHYRKESLGDDSQWKCPKCQKLRNATKTMMLWKLPLILIIHLKRFEQVGATYQKKDTYVHFPLHSLKFDDFIHEHSDYKPEPYILFAVTNHGGSADRGHYTAFCRNPVKGSWFRYDDELVTSMKEDSVKTRSAYILYYTRFNWFRNKDGSK